MTAFNNLLEYVATHNRLCEHVHRNETHQLVTRRPLDTCHDVLWRASGFAVAYQVQLIGALASLTAQHPSRLAGAVVVAAAAADAAAVSCLQRPRLAVQLGPLGRFPLCPQLVMPRPAQPLTPGLLLPLPLLLLPSLLLKVLLLLLVVFPQSAALLLLETPPAHELSSVKV